MVILIKEINNRLKIKGDFAFSGATVVFWQKGGEMAFLVVLRG